MRTVLLAILLASVARVPVVAAQVSVPNANAAEAQHQSRPQHNSRPSNSGRTAPVHVERRSGGAEYRSHSVQGTTGVRIMRPPETGRITAPSAGQPRPGQVRTRPFEGRPQITRPGRENPLRPPAQIQRHTLPERPVISNVPHRGTEPPLKAGERPMPKPHWNSSWRKDHRYDWQNWRRHHHHRFHLHPYFDPFGWGYYHYWIGWRLWPGYYGSHYWITDPWYYRLPPAPPGTRWVRYYNDAVLVDMWSGEVIDIIYGFFW